MPVTERSKHFSFTINNYATTTITNLRSVINTEWVNYICFQEEVGEQGTPHIQGYIQCNSRKRFSQVNGILGGRASLQESRGSDEDNYNYCSKDDSAVENTFQEFGERRQIARKRKAEDDDFESLISFIREGHTLREVIEKFPMMAVKNLSNIERIYHLYKRKPLFVFNGPFKWSLPETFSWDKTLILVGPSGIGKTEWAKTLIENPLFVTHLDDLKRFDPNEHGGIIFDDMTFNHLPRTSAIHLVDNDNPRSIHVRYGRAELPAKTKKIITTNLWEIFPEDHTGAIERRCFYYQVE